jgi:hypothetical protein
MKHIAEYTHARMPQEVPAISAVRHEQQKYGNQNNMMIYLYQGIFSASSCTP